MKARDRINQYLTARLSTLKTNFDLTQQSDTESIWNMDTQLAIQELRYEINLIFDNLNDELPERLDN